MPNTVQLTQNGQPVFPATDATVVTGLATVATSGSYNDLTNKPTIPTDLSDLSDDSTHRLVTDTEKATWNGKYTKPASGIPASDIASGVIPDVSGKYEKPSTGIPKTDLAQGVQDSLALADSALQSFTETDPTVPSWAKAQNPPTEIFWATYGTTTHAEVLAAYNAGKMVALSYNDKIYTFQIKTSANILYFYCVDDYNHRWVRVNESNAWASGSYKLEWTSNKVSTISGNETNTDKYPNTKAMADALGKMGVIRQTQTWTQAADGGYDYTMSDLVRGLIPQANIDLFESAGAVFNASTGYFELNGLTDISYEEMQAVYDDNFSAKMVSMNIVNALRIVKPARTVNLSDGVVYFSMSLLNGLRVGSGGAGSGDSSIEVVAVGTIGGYPANVSIIQQMLYKCPYVKRVGINQPINFTSTSASNASLAFQNCFSLEEVMLKGLAVSIEFKQSPRLTAASVAYLISNAGTATITITLHATAYARATADAAVQAALAAKTNVTLASA